MSAPRTSPRAAPLARTLLLAGTLVVGVPIVGAPALAAQSGGGDPRLAGRLDPATATAVAALVDSAKTADLPTEPLVRRALQGAVKRADGARIVAAVRSLARELDQARAALGPAPEAELVAGAGALHAGVTPATLHTLRVTRPGRPLTVPLAVLADLVSAGVPADTAARAVLALAERGVSDAEFTVLRTDVERDVERGAPPGASAVLRATGPTGAPVPRQPAAPPAGAPRPGSTAPLDAAPLATPGAHQPT